MGIPDTGKGEKVMAPLVIRGTPWQFLGARQDPKGMTIWQDLEDCTLVHNCMAEIPCSQCGTEATELPT